MGAFGESRSHHGKTGNHSRCYDRAGPTSGSTGSGPLRGPARSITAFDVLDGDTC
jgi:hypothetical protein